jgi:hypothetical protein
MAPPLISYGDSRLVLGTITTLVSRESNLRIYERLEERAGVNLAPAECWPLFRIDAHGPATPQELAASLDLSEADLRPRLQALRDSELITGGDEHEPLAASPEGKESVSLVRPTTRMAGRVLPHG